MIQGLLLFDWGEVSCTYKHVWESVILSRLKLVFVPTLKLVFVPNFGINPYTKKDLSKHPN